MIELKTQFPYVDDNGKTYSNLIKHYAEDEQGNRYYILQIETGIRYSEAVDIYPCKYTYEATNEKIEKYKLPDEGE